MSSGSDISRWRLAALLAPLMVLAPGGFAVLYPTYSTALLVVLAALVVLLMGWAAALAVGGGWRRRTARSRYSAAVIASFAACGVALAWRALGGGAGLGAVCAALFGAAALAGLAFRRPLSAVIAWRGGAGVTQAAGVGAVTLGLVVFLAVRLAPVWFAQHLLLPAMLLLVLIAAAGVVDGAFR